MQIHSIFLPLLLSLFSLHNEATSEHKLNDKHTFISSPQKDKLQWLTLSEAEANMNIQKRDIIIDLYTDWCSWCKVMDRNTYTNSDVIQYLQNNFYPVKINAETREVLHFQGRQFKYNESYRVHDFAILLTGGQLSYPSTIILPADGSTPQVIPGYLKPADMELVLKYFGEGQYGKTPFETYRQSFKQSWK